MRRELQVQVADGSFSRKARGKRRTRTEYSTLSDTSLSDTSLYPALFLIRRFFHPALFLIRHFSLLAILQNTRSQAPAWERTALEALPRETEQALPDENGVTLKLSVDLQAGACEALGSQAGAWEPVVVD